MATERYVRDKGQWVKITRYAEKREFVLARGFDGEFKAHDIQRWGFKWLPTWSDAVEMAKDNIKVHA